MAAHKEDETMRYLITTTVMAFGLVCSLGGMSALAAEKAEIKLSVATNTITAFCLKASMNRHPKFQDFIKEQNISLRATKLTTSQVPVTVNYGDLDVGECSGISTVTNAWNKGATNIFIFAVGSIKPVYVLIGGKKIKKIQDLKGGKLGIPGMQSASTEAIEMILKRGGNLVQPRDYTLISAGAGSARVAALIAGKVDAIPTFPPYNYDLVDKGYNFIADEATYVPQYTSGAHIANREWAEKNRDVFVRLIKAYVKTGMWLEDPANKEKVISWLAENLVIGRKAMGRAYAARFYKDIIGDKRLSFNGYADESAIRANLAILEERGFLKKDKYPPLAKMVDFSYLNQALKELGLPTVKEIK